MRIRWPLTVAALIALTAAAGAQTAPPPNIGEDPTVTTVRGPSWLTRLGLPLNRTTLGQGAGRFGPPPDQARVAGHEALGVPRTMTASGGDLYRYSCQACHRAEGTGSPPEIHSLLGAVQGSSLALVRAQLKQQGGASTGRTARAAADKSRMKVLQRMHCGGQRMPPRDYLHDNELRLLFAYLTKLAAVPDVERQSSEVVSWSRLGELVVKGTCHICHDAVGPPPSGRAMLVGAVPSLEALLETRNVREFVHKARSGEVVSRGDVSFEHRGRMPVFYYLRDVEVAAAYVYLATYPPQPSW